MIRVPGLKITAYNVNDRVLFNEINKTMLENVLSEPVQWENEDHRSIIRDMVDEMLDFMAQNKKLSQHDVLCDKRNNAFTKLSKGIVNFELRFIQWNCLNVTRVVYTMDTKRSMDAAKIKVKFINGIR